MEVNFVRQLMNGLVLLSVPSIWTTSALIVISPDKDSGAFLSMVFWTSSYSMPKLSVFSDIVHDCDIN